MSKVLREGYFGYEDHLFVTSAIVTATWMPGQFAMADTGDPTYMNISTGTHNVYGIILDDDDEVAAPPSASVVTVLHGKGKVYINHKEEVDASSAARAYELGTGNPESGTIHDCLYVNNHGKIFCSSSGSASALPDMITCVGSLIQKPDAGNNYTVGFLMKI